MKAFIADRHEKNGVNVLDPKIHDGDFKLVLKYNFPPILGNDVAGVVTLA